MRREADMLRLFPEYLKGEELFGLTVHAVLRIAESVSTGAGGKVGILVLSQRIRHRSVPVSAAPWGGELSELFIPLWAPPPDGTTAHDQPHRLCQIRTENPHTLQTVSLCDGAMGCRYGCG